MLYGVVNKHYSKICESQVEYMEVGTPLTTNYYIGSPHGEIYGLEHDIRRFSSPEIASELRPDTEIAGLWLTGMKHFVILFLLWQNNFRLC